MANIFSLEFFAWGKKKLGILHFPLSPYSGPTGKGLPSGVSYQAFYFLDIPNWQLHCGVLGFSDDLRRTLLRRVRAGVVNTRLLLGTIHVWRIKAVRFLCISHGEGVIFFVIKS